MRLVRRVGCRSINEEEAEEEEEEEEEEEKEKDRRYPSVRLVVC